MVEVDDASAGVTLSSGPIEATFLPDLGMVGVSLRHRGGELLVLPKGLAGYQHGGTAGLPLLAPWANRLGSWRYAVDGAEVDLTGLDLHTDENGLPIHGTMAAQHGWRVVAESPSTLVADFDFGARPDLLRSFPFPHVIQLAASLGADALTVTTTVRASTDRPVPIAFGYHPYFRLPGIDRAEVRLSLPARRHLVLDSAGLPTGEVVAQAAEDLPIGDRTFDDLYELGATPRMSVAGGGRRLTLELVDGYHYAQVFIPPGGDTVSLEPMTSPTNALVTGGYPLARPRTDYTATFTLRLDADYPPQPQRGP
jgi:aldose 1-epimerase